MSFFLIFKLLVYDILEIFSSKYWNVIKATPFQEKVHLKQLIGQEFTQFGYRIEYSALYSRLSYLCACESSHWCICASKMWVGYCNSIFQISALKLVIFFTNTVHASNHGCGIASSWNTISNKHVLVCLLSGGT